MDRSERPMSAHDDWLAEIAAESETFNARQAEQRRGANEQLWDLVAGCPHTSMAVYDKQAHMYRCPDCGAQTPTPKTKIHPKRRPLPNQQSLLDIL